MPPLARGGGGGGGAAVVTACVVTACFGSEGRDAALAGGLGAGDGEALVTVAGAVTDVIVRAGAVAGTALAG